MVHRTCLNLLNSSRYLPPEYRDRAGGISCSFPMPTSMLGTQWTINILGLSDLKAKTYSLSLFLWLFSGCVWDKRWERYLVYLCHQLITERHQGTEPCWVPGIPWWMKQLLHLGAQSSVSQASRQWQSGWWSATIFLYIFYLKQVHISKMYSCVNCFSFHY